MGCGSPGVVDAHFHFIAPPDRFPMLAARSYTPVPASLSDWRERLAPLGVTRGVLVQPSIHGTDNRLLLATVAEAQGQLVAVAAVRGDIDDEALDALVAAGVRGVRMAYFEPGDERARGGLVPLSHFDRLEARLVPDAAFTCNC
jgi:2-pyrone-4,6-dicarboxylate lactonase